MVYHALKGGTQGQRSWPLASVTRVASLLSLARNRAALDLIAVAVDKAGLKLGTDIVLALDVAASEFYDDGKGVYTFEGVEKSADEMTAYYAELASAYPIVSIEDR